MSYTIHLTENWPYEKIAKYSTDITNAIRKITERFPDDISLEKLARNIAEGREQFWLILDENQKFAAFVTTEIEITQSGKKRLLLLELAGEGGPDIADMIVSIEEWAKSIGVTEICPFGRIGWLKVMKKHGYKPFIIKYRKEL